LLTTLQPHDDPVVNAMDIGGEVLVNELGSAVADDEIAIGSVGLSISAFGANTEILLECEQY